MAKNENEMKEIYRVQDEHNPLFRDIVQMQGKCP